MAIKKSIRFGDKDYTYTEGRLDAGTLKEFFAWIKTQEPDPFIGLKDFLGMVPESDRKPMIEEARQRAFQLASLNLQSPIVQQYIESPVGMCYIAGCILRVDNPNLSLDEAFQIWTHMNPEEVKRLIELAEKSTKGFAAKNDLGPDKTNGAQSTGSAKPSIDSKSNVP